MAHGQANAEIVSDGSPSLSCNHEAPICFNTRQDPDVSGEVSQPIGRKDTGHGVVIPINPNALRGDTRAINPSPDAEGHVRLRNPALGIGVDGGPADTLQAAGPGAVAFSCKDSGADAGEISPTLRSMNFSDSHANGGRTGCGRICSEHARRSSRDGHSRVLESRTRNASDYTYSQRDAQVRRLTPRECERLQGFPDDYTNIPWRGKSDSPDGPRYKAIGNSMAVPVMAWIGRRIERVELIERVIQRVRARLAEGGA